MGSVRDMAPNPVLTTPQASAVLDRLVAACKGFDLTDEQIRGLRARGHGAVLSELSILARESSSPSRTWFLLACLTARYPTPNEVRTVWRRLKLSSTTLAHRAVLAHATLYPEAFIQSAPAITIVSDRVIVDVNFSATHEHNSGIQRVVRQTMSRWHRDHDVLFVGWTQDGEAMRTLTASETDRVVRFGESRTKSRPGEPLTVPAVIIPLKSTIIVPEVPFEHLCEPLQSLAEFSNNRVGLIGYDTIPVVSADSVPEEETNRFVKYLSMLKHVDRVAGISAAATEEFRGFCAALAPQGISGPVVTEVSLPLALPDQRLAGGDRGGDIPMLLCVGSQEPRKNQLAVLFAAEKLWREGLSFSLQFIGGGSASFVPRFDRIVRRLRSRGRHIVVMRSASDAVLLQAYQRARFLVFPSIHEGYGLPVAEALALGTPVLTTQYGSTAEIAAHGGCVVVDPRDDEDIVRAMRRLLRDDDLIQRLSAESQAITAAQWDDYAADLWRELVVNVGHHDAG